MKKKVYSYNRMDKDVSPAKQSEGTYFDAQNVRIIMNGDSFSVTNVEGNSLSLQLPHITKTSDSFVVTNRNGTIIETVNFVSDGDNNLNNVSDINGADLRIIGHCYIRDYLVLLTTPFTGSNPTGDSAAVLTVFTWDGTTLSLKYCNAADVSRKHPMRRVVSRYENDNIQKVYLTDDFNQLRLLNLADSNLINTPPEVLDVSPSVKFSQIVVSKVIEGGSFEQGIVQYAYSLYSDNGTESKISSLSLPYLVDDTVLIGNKSLEVSLSTIDTKFDYIKVYRILYDTITGTPIISLIADESTTDSFSFVDDGSVVIANIPVEDFLFLGGDPFVCKDIAIKDNRLVAANIKQTFFEVDYDARAFRFDKYDAVSNPTPVSLVGDNNNNYGDATIVDGFAQISSSTFTADIGDIPTDCDCFNPSNKAETNVDFRDSRYTHDTTLTDQDKYYNTFIYKKNGINIGGEGLNVSYEIKTSTRNVDSFTNKPEVGRTTESFQSTVRYHERSYKRDEVYRFAVRFRNKFGQYTFPKWIGDIRMPNQDTHPISSSTERVDDIYIEFKLENLPSEVVSCEIVRVERDQANSTILTQAYITDSIRTPVIEGVHAHSTPFVDSYFPRPLMGTLNNGALPLKRQQSIGDARYTPLVSVAAPDNDNYFTDDSLLFLYSPEITEKDVSLTGEYLNVVGFTRSRQGGFHYYINNNLSDNKQYSFFDGSTQTNLNNPFQINTVPGAAAQSRYQNFYRKGSYNQITRIARVNVTSDIKFTESSGFKTLTSQNRADKKIAFQSGYRKFNSNADDHFGILDNETSIVLDIYKGAGTNEGLSTIVERSSNYLSYDLNPSNPQYSTLGDFYDLFVMVDFKQNLPNQYGGDSFEAIQRSKYMSVANTLTKSGISNVTFNVKNGDTFVGMWTFTKTSVATPITGSFETGCRDVLMLPIESRYNMDMYEYPSRDTIESHKEISYDKGTYNKYNKVFHREPNVVSIASKPYNFTVNNIYDSRFKISQSKVNGEIQDSFMDFRELDFFDVNASFGPITGIMEYNDNIYFFQPEGVGIMQISPRIQTVGSDGVSIALGTGSLLQDAIYISTSLGSSHQFSLIKSDYGIYFFDSITRKFCLVRGQVEPISDIKGMHEWFRESALTGKDVYAGYSKIKNEVYLSLRTDFDQTGDTFDYTLLYSEYTQGFVSFLGGRPSMYIPWRDRLFTSFDGPNQLWEENTADFGYPMGTFYGNNYSSSITITLNPSPLNTCIFDTIAYNSQVTISGIDQPLETLTNIKCFNQYQDSGLQVVDAKRKFREWRVNIPREQNTRNRMRSQHAYLKLQYNNANNKKLVLEDIILNYRDAPASFV